MLDNNFFISIVTTIISIFFGFLISRYYFIKSENNKKNKLRNDRIQILNNFSIFLSKQIVKHCLENEPYKLTIERIKANIYGKLKSSNSSHEEPTLKEMLLVLNQSISIIEEQEFISLCIKNNTINIILELIEKLNFDEQALTLPKIVKSEPYDIQIYPLVENDISIYIYSIVLTLLVIFYKITQYSGKSSETLVTIYMFGLMIFILLTYVFYSGKLVTSSLKLFLRIHTTVAGVLFFIFFLIAKSTNDLSKTDPLYNLISFIISWIFYLLPLSYCITFIYVCFKRVRINVIKKQ